MTTTTISLASEFKHTPFYCEENVYLLCKELSSTGIANSESSDLFVVFISNEKKQIPLWHQKASNRADGVVLWDYHVICIQRKCGGAGLPAQHLVWDLDSSLAFPCALSIYVSETICPKFQTFPEFQRYFRVVHAPLFLRSFASDRRHMKDSLGEWIHEPPPYEPIVSEDGTIHNLNDYFDICSTNAVKEAGYNMTNAIFTEKLGLVVGENQLEKLFFQIP